MPNLERASYMFIHCVIGNDVGCGYGDYVFVADAIPLPYHLDVRFTTLFTSTESPVCMEYGVIYDNDKPMALYRRELLKGKPDPDSVGIYRLYPDPLDLTAIANALGKIEVRDVTQIMQ